MPNPDDSDPISPPLDPAPLRFFEGFVWAVPTAFSAALAGFRFEQGDVLFRDPDAYDAIEDGFESGARAIQILNPPRSARSAPAEFEGDRRRTSWESEVEIELVDLASGRSEPLRLSQGKLLMVLWRGDEAWLDSEREEPPMPRTARELAQQLEQARGAFDALQTTPKGSRFLFVVDLASDASRVKAQTVEEALASLGAVERLDLFPTAAGIADAEDFHPALVLRALVVAGASAAAVEQALKRALYSGGSRSPIDAEGEGESPASDRFSVARHGVVDELGV